MLLVNSGVKPFAYVSLGCKEDVSGIKDTRDGSGNVKLMEILGMDALSRHGNYFEPRKPVLSLGKGSGTLGFPSEFIVHNDTKESGHFF